MNNKYAKKGQTPAESVPIFATVRSVRMKGFSLVELMVALFILAVVMCTIIVGFSQLQAMGKKTEMVMIAGNLAQQRMEMAMRKPFENLDTLSESLHYIDQYGNDSGSATDFKRETIIFENYSGDSRLTQVTIKVSYKSYGYRVGIGSVSEMKILTGEVLEKGWSPAPIELITIMVDN